MSLVRTLVEKLTGPIVFARRLPSRFASTPSTSGTAFHDEIASGWDNLYSTGSFKRRAELVCKLLSSVVEPGHTWLDAGCGSGYFSRQLVRLGAHAVGVDGSAAMIDAAVKLASAEGISDSVSFKHIETVERMNLANDSFNGVLCLSVIEYVADPDSVIREIARVVRPGGTLILSVPHAHSPVRLLQTAMRKLAATIGVSLFGYLGVSVNSYLTADLTKILEKFGLSVRAIHPFDAYVSGWLLKVVPSSLLFVVASRAH